MFPFEFPSLALLFISLLDRMQPVRDASLTSLLKKRSCFWFKETIFSQTSEAWQVDNAMGLSSCSWYFPLCSHPAPSPASTLPWSLLCAQVLAQLPLPWGLQAPSTVLKGVTVLLRYFCLFSPNPPLSISSSCLSMCLRLVLCTSCSFLPYITILLVLLPRPHPSG